MHVLCWKKMFQRFSFGYDKKKYKVQPTSRTYNHFKQKQNKLKHQLCILYTSEWNCGCNVFQNDGESKDRGTALSKLF